MRRVAVTPDDLTTPAWSPDGRSLAAVGNLGERSEMERRSTIYLLDPDDPDVAPRPLFTLQEMRASDVAFSPEGDRIAVCGHDDPAKGHYGFQRLWIVDVASGEGRCASERHDVSFGDYSRNQDLRRVGGGRRAALAARRGGAAAPGEPWRGRPIGALRPGAGRARAARDRPAGRERVHDRRRRRHRRDAHRRRRHARRALHPGGPGGRRAGAPHRRERRAPGRARAARAGALRLALGPGRGAGLDPLAPAARGGVPTRR